MIQISGKPNKQSVPDVGRVHRLEGRGDVYIARAGRFRGLRICFAIVRRPAQTLQSILHNLGNAFLVIIQRTAPLALTWFLAVALCCVYAQAVWAQATKTTSIAAGSKPQENQIMIVYPDNSAKISARSTFFIGSCHSGDRLSCNGQSVRLNSSGFFAHVVQLQPGDNTFVFSEDGSVQAQRTMHVTREVGPLPIADNDICIDKTSLQPQLNQGVAPGDLIEFSVRATPDSDVAITLGDRHVPLYSLSREAKVPPKGVKQRQSGQGQLRLRTLNVNTGLDAAYGQVYQRYDASKRDRYFGFYKVATEDTWKQVKPVVVLKHGDKVISLTYPAGVTVIQQPACAETVHESTIVRLGPGLARTTPLAKGVRLLVDGWQGDQMRCIYAPHKHVWIDRSELIFENQPADTRSAAGANGSGAAVPAPHAVARTINIAGDEYGQSVIIPLNQRLPYQIEQQVSNNKLIMRIFGVTSDTDWVSDPASDPHGSIENISFKQPVDNQYEITVQLKGKRQWGYKVDYDQTNLILHIKWAPHIVADDLKSNHKLNGLKICLDPGHGGNETGAIGPSGETEAAVNLAIAQRLKALLESEGALVTMTRTTDVDVSLDERVRIANDKSVDILLSIHNNALPDGRDPWRERGTSSYWYHPQSCELARFLKNGLLQTLSLPDLGCRFENLALVRPTAMPAVLVEVGFMINPDDYALLITPAGQEKAAAGLLTGLHDYFLQP